TTQFYTSSLHDALPIWSYHGSTHGSLSVSGNENKKRAFRPLLPDVRFLTFDNLEELEQISTRTACVIMETIQGDAGVRIPSQALDRKSTRLNSSHVKIS